MEKRLSEYRNRKQAEFKVASPGFSHPSREKRPHIFVTLLKRMFNYITSSYLFQTVSQKMSRIPVLGKPFVLKILLWLILFGLFVELEFGIVYVIVSLFVVIYLNTSTKKRSKHTLSAYSVFNKDFETIDGTFTAEQFEKELTNRR